MTGVEVIMAALAAGVGAGTHNAAKTAISDAYAGLRALLRRRLSGRYAADRALEADEIELGTWRARLSDDLRECGADQDRDVLAAAHRLLALTDPGGTEAGKYTVDLHGAPTVHVGTAYGPTAGTMTGPVTVTYGQVPLPPSQPGA